MSITATNITMIPFSSEIAQKLIKSCRFEWWSEDIDWFIWYNRENDTLYVFWNDSDDRDPEEIRSHVIKELNVKAKEGTAGYPLL